VSEDLKYLVTGAGGQLGSEWLRFLQKQGSAFKAFGSDELDITDASAVSSSIETVKPDIVINCAAYTNVDRAESEPEAAYSVNRDGVGNLAKACRDVGILMVHYSTDYVFPGRKDDENNYPDGYPEDAAPGPVNRYGKTKLAGEEVLLKSGTDFLLIRVSWLCGPGGSNFINSMLRLRGDRESVNVVDDQTGSPSYTFDVVEKTDRLIRRDKRGIFHISSGGKLSWADFAAEIFRLTGSGTVVNRIPSSEYPMDAARPAFSLLSKQKLIHAGLKPVDWKKGLNNFLELQRQNA
jgi:dTDP-4-dehydrorhamnose reductase